MRRDIQLRVIRDISSCIYCAPAKAGTLVWVTSEEAARHLIESGLCEWLNGSATRVVGPSETPRAGPSAVKEVGVLAAGKPCCLPNGWPVDRFAVVEPVWRGETVVCIASGPSVTSTSLVGVSQKARSIAVNDTYLIAPWADICYFADARWHDWHTHGVAKPELGLSAEDVARRFREFAGQKVTIENTGMSVQDPRVFILRNYTQVGQPEGLSAVPNGLHTGSNSGYQAINLAVLAGARRVLLVGYDMRFVNGKTHFHGGHPSKHPEDVYLRYARRFNNIVPAARALGIEIINCTPGSAVKAFPFGDLEEELEKI